MHHNIDDFRSGRVGARPDSSQGSQDSTRREHVEAASENGLDIYRIAYKTDGEVTTVKLQKDAMVPYSVSTVTVRNAMTVESSTHVSLTEDIESEGIIVLSFRDLRYILRGYPFARNAPDLGIAFLESNTEDDDDSPDFEIRVSYAGIEEVELADRTLNCHKLELKMKASGILRVLNGFIGKSYFWYSVEAPHYMVAYEGNSSFPGSPKSRVTIVDYSGWE
jgi:hypothetical protein